MKKQLKTFLSRIDCGLRKIAQWGIRLYQWTFSPDKSILFSPFLRGRICRHEPHCSQYGYECFQEYNFLTASYRTMDRISRCTPGLEKSYDPVKYRVVFASGSPIGVPFLEALVHDPRYDVVGVLTMPDMPRGRGMKMQENVIALTSYELWIEKNAVHKPGSLRLDSKKYADEAQESTEWLHSLDIDILYVVAYGNILPQHILEIPKIVPVNIHGSLLPAYRGASPLQQVFIDGLSETGITLMRMEAGLDSGPMIDKQIFKLGFSDTVADLIQKVKEYTPKRSLESIDAYVHGEIEEQKQDESLVTHCGKISKEDGFIVLSIDDLETIYTKYKAFVLRPKLWFIWWDKRIVIDELKIDEVQFEIHKQELLQKNGELNPAIQEIILKPEGKKSMVWKDFTRGYL